MRGEGDGPARILASIAATCVSRRRVVAPAGAVIAVGLAVAAFAGLRPSAGTESLVPKASSASAATDRIHSRFGDDPIIVMAEEPLSKLLLSPDLGRLLKLEGCLSGNVPKGASPYGGANSPCARIAATGSVMRVYGPATFLNEAAGQISAQVGVELRRAAAEVKAAQDRARSAALAQGLGQAAADEASRRAGIAAQGRAAAVLTQLQLRTGIKGLPSIANADFVSGIAFDPAKGVGEPKARFSYLFPSPNAALIQVRPKAGLAAAERRNLAALVEAATRMPDFKLSDGRYRVTGAGVLAESLADDVASAALPLLLAAVIAMAVALGLAFRVSSRLLPLWLALLAAAGVFGAMAILGLPLTIAAVGGVPVLIGLAVDYGVQFQARAAEEEDDRALAGETPDPDAAVVEAARKGGPPILAAAAATAAGLLALLASPAPMVRGFGLVLVAGVVLALVIAFTVGAALIPSRAGRTDAFSKVADSLDSSVRGAGELLAGLPGRGAVAGSRRSVAGAFEARPGRVVVVALLLAVIGWGLEGSLAVESDVTRLVPSGTPALSNLEALQRESGVAGEVDVLVAGPRATAPDTLTWLKSVQARVLRASGYSEQNGCRKGAELCPGVAITDLIGNVRTESQVSAVLAALPEYFRSAVVSPDRQAVLASFGIGLLPLERQQEVLDRLRSNLRDAPPGVSVSVGGLPVIAAEANDRLADPESRLLLTLIALMAVGLVLLLTLRSPRRALVPLAATAVASGWAPLGLWIVGVELNPLSAALGALVIAIGTEFAVLLSERHHAELAAPGGSAGALDRALGTTGRAIRVSGLTVVTGFGVLWFSDIRVLRDFGLATVIDLALALAAVAIVVPALLRWLDRGERD